MEKNITNLGRRFFDAGYSVPKMVAVQPDSPEIPGKRYQTIANALTYIDTQSPSASNKWGVLVGGINTENFTIPSFVGIYGMFGQTQLVGEITTGVSTDPFAFIIENCIVYDLVLPEDGLVSAIYCVVAGVTSDTNSGIIANDSMIIAGDFSNCAKIDLLRCEVQPSNFLDGITFSGSVVSRFCGLWGQDSTTLVLNGGWFINSNFGGIDYMTLNTGDYRLNCCNTDNDFSIPDDTIFRLYNCTGFEKTITVEDGGVLNSYSLGGLDVVVESGGTWNSLDFLPNRLPAYADDADAGTGGLTAGEAYVTDGTGSSPLDVAGIVMVKQ